MNNEISLSEEEKNENLEDIFYGQIVFIWARWVVIASALFLILFKADSVRDIQLPVIPLILLMVINFFIHGRYVMRKPANAIFLTIATLVDMTFVTFIIILGGGGTTGIDNPFFVLYYPLVLAFSLVFPRKISIVCVSVLLVIYFLICLLMKPGVDLAGGDEEILAVRIITILCTAILGTMYWRSQRSRRRGEAK
jgi:hypothetical protein